MNEPNLVTCCAEGCDTQIDLFVESSFYEHVHGWDRKRRQGGQNHLRLRRPLNDEYMCTSCMNRLLRGVAETQVSMW